MKTRMDLETDDDFLALEDIAGAAPAMAAQVVAAGVHEMRQTMGYDTGQLHGRTGITQVSVSGPRTSVRFVADTPYAAAHDDLHSQFWQQGIQEIAAQAAGLNTTLAHRASEFSDGTADPKRVPWTQIDPATVTI